MRRRWRVNSAETIRTRGEKSSRVVDYRFSRPLITGGDEPLCTSLISEIAALGTERIMLLRAGKLAERRNKIIGKE